MTKIGIAIAHSFTGNNSSGFNVKFKTDEGEWRDAIEDTGRVFNYIDTDFIESNGSMVRMVKFASHGWFLCSMKLVSGRDGEYRASWIYFPAGLSLEANDIYNIMKEAEMNIMSNDIDIQAIRDIVECHASTNVNAPWYDLAANRSGYAIRYVGDENPTLLEVFRKIYQSEFTEYEWVILMKRSEVKVHPGRQLTDLTTKPLRDSRVVEPQVDYRFGFEPYFNGSRFAKPVRIIEGEPIQIVWKRQGYVDIKKNGTSCVEESDVQKIISGNDIFVISRSGARIFYEKIELSHAQENEAQRVWIVRYSDLTKARFAVTAKGYKPEPVDRIDLTKIEYGQQIVIQLNEDEHTYKFKVCLDKKKQLFTPDFEYTSQGRLEKVPFDGFKLERGPVPRENEVNVLVLDVSASNNGSFRGSGSHNPTPPPIPGAPQNGKNGKKDKKDKKKGEEEKYKNDTLKEKLIDTLKIISIIIIVVILLLAVILLIFQLGLYEL